MDTDNSSDLFEIKLSDEGIKYIKKFVTVAKFLVLLGVLVSILMISTSVLRLMPDNLDDSSLDFWQTIYFRGAPYFTLLHTILFVVQLFYYWKLKRLLTEGIKNKNEIAFNQSFRALFLNSIWGVITVGCSLVISIFDTFIFLNYYI